MNTIGSDTAALPYDDYAQSANSLFHFVTKPNYLKSILSRGAIIPRYCVETIDYLGIKNDGHLYRDVAILQKCFCDIPFHKLADRFSVTGVGDAYESLTASEKTEVEKNNTHFAYYGEYAIAFSKRWGEQNNLQPVHYLNPDSQYTKDFASLFEVVFNSDDISDLYAQDILNRLAFIKPLRGIMQRRVMRKDSRPITVEIYKNFHDECEWRFVPSEKVLAPLKIESVIANPTVIPLCNNISGGLENSQYKDLWLTFSYDEIRYIIVPDNKARIEIIQAITDLAEDCFKRKEDIPMQKSILISKIMVLNEIRKDW